MRCRGLLWCWHRHPPNPTANQVREAEDPTTPQRTARPPPGRSLRTPRTGRSPPPSPHPTPQAHPRHGDPRAFGTARSTPASRARAPSGPSAQTPNVCTRLSSRLQELSTVPLHVLDAAMCTGPGGQQRCSGGSPARRPGRNGRGSGRRTRPRASPAWGSPSDLRATSGSEPRRHAGSTSPPAGSARGGSGSPRRGPIRPRWGQIKPGGFQQPSPRGQVRLSGPLAINALTAAFARKSAIVDEKLPASPSPKPAATDTPPSPSRQPRHSDDNAPARDHRAGPFHTQTIGTTNDGIIGRINDGQHVADAAIDKAKPFRRTYDGQAHQGRLMKPPRD